MFIIIDLQCLTDITISKKVFNLTCYTTL